MQTHAANTLIVGLQIATGLCICMQLSLPEKFTGHCKTVAIYDAITFGVQNCKKKKKKKKDEKGKKKERPSENARNNLLLCLLC